MMVTDSTAGALLLLKTKEKRKRKAHSLCTPFFCLSWIKLNLLLLDRTFKKKLKGPIFHIYVFVLDSSGVASQN